MNEGRRTKRQRWSFGWQAELLERGAKLGTATRELAEAAEALARHAGLTWAGAGEASEVAPLARLSSIPETGEDVSWSLTRDVVEMQAQAEMTTDKLTA
ncbi:hypothetical protein [Paracoccus homiensis]|uniref:hypothetical protein n=1 Tax=Paracoccus homiensis TaxID=364199 RepID=UPI00398D54EF